MHYGSGSVIPSRSAGFTNTGSPRPARPGQLDQMMADNIAGGADPAQINEMSHASAAALLDRVHHTQDAELVERVLTLVDREGVDVIAELWSRSEPDSLPGILWRLYVLRTGMRVRMVMVCIIAISAFFILLNSSLAWRVDITYLFFLNLFCWSILHVGLNGLIERNRNRRQ